MDAAAAEVGGEVARAYLAVAGALGHLLPGSFGPLPVATSDGSVGRRTPAALVREAGRLADALPGDLSPERARFLAGQVEALEVTARRLAGQRFAVTDEMRRVYGVSVTLGEPDDYRAAHRELDALLPGTGPLGPRLHAYRERERVPPARLGTAVHALSAALRAVTAARLGLPDIEHVDYRFVDAAPWSALHRGEGLRSMVTVNTAVSFRPTQLARLVAHEAYPGHHTERCHKAVGLVARGRVEHAATLTASPQSTVAEGAADLGLRALVGPGWGTWTQDVLAADGLPVDGALAARVDDALARLAPVRLDAALLLPRRGPDGVAEHLRRWALADARGIAQISRFLHDPVWRIYGAASVAGPALVRRWWYAQPDDVRLRRLLSASLTPSDLRVNRTDQTATRSAQPATDGVRRTTSGRPVC